MPAAYVWVRSRWAPRLYPDGYALSVGTPLGPLTWEAGSGYWEPVPPEGPGLDWAGYPLLHQYDVVTAGGLPADQFM